MPAKKKPASARSRKRTSDRAAKSAARRTREEKVRESDLAGENAGRDTGAVVRKAEKARQQALDAFFASGEELEAVRSMSLDLYRDELDARLRLEGVREYLSFVLADELFATDIYNIREIIKLPMITEVPRTDPVILGVLSLRGTIAPVVDLRRRLGLGEVTPTRKTRVLIIDLGQDLVGMMVDEVRNVIRLREDAIEPRPAVFDRSEAEYITGVGRAEGEMYTLLDMSVVADIERFIVGSRSER
ncbi:MAG TPA: hypothetical protein ENH48_05775 [Halieaceae bacterium]|nr:hypothetical protein [Halieaceae bacterium]